MVKQFLPGMLERRKGRIVAMCSISAKVSLPMGSAYTATKYGLDGLMEAIWDELCIDDYDEFIKLSTVYPYFVNTRKELSDMLEEMEDPVTRLTPEYVADVTVEKSLMNKRHIVITPLKFLLIVQ